MKRVPQLVQLSVIKVNIRGEMIFHIGSGINARVAIRAVPFFPGTGPPVNENLRNNIRIHLWLCDISFVSLDVRIWVIKTVL